MEDLRENHKGHSFPTEIKSGKTGSLKSLPQFMDSVGHPFAVRIYGGEFKVQKSVTPSGTPFILMNLPYHLGTMIPEYLDYFISEHQI